MNHEKDPAAVDALNSGAMLQLETAYAQSAEADQTIARELSGTDDDGLEGDEW